MRYLAVLLSAFGLSASLSVASAQAGFTTESYPAVLSAANHATKLLSTDVNGDGFPDLVAYGGSTVSVFYNDGSGGFGPAQQVASGMNFNAVAVADMNGDTLPDIVGCTNSNPTGAYLETVTVLLNNGDGTFTAQAPATNAGQCSKVLIGDAYGTGYPAVITGGTQPGQYGPGGQFYPGNSVYVDLFTNDGTGQVYGTGQLSGGFGAPNGGADYNNCALADMVGGNFRQAGTFDLVVTTSCHPADGATNEGTVYYGIGGTASTQAYGTFTYQQSVAGAYTSGRVVDLNGDGKLDLVYTNTTTSGSDLVTGINSGSGTFTFTNNTNSAAATIGGDAAADFNQDGHVDLVDSASGGVAEAPAASALNIYNGTTAGTYPLSQTIQTASTASTPGDVLTMDLNRDGRPDIATLVTNTSTGTTSLLVYLNTQGSGSICVAPMSTDANTVCTPQSGTTIASGSPVIVSAASNVPMFTLNRVYLDNKAVFQTASQTVSAPIQAGSGTHNLVLVSYNSTGQAFTSSTRFTVGAAGGTSCIPYQPGAAICGITNDGTYPSQLPLTAGAKAKSGYLTALRVYVDNNPVYTTNNPSQSTTYQLTTNLTLGAGQHSIVVVAYESTGGAVTSSVEVIVPPASCTPTATGVDVCSPAAGATVASPVNFAATAYSSSTSVYGLTLVVDDQSYSMSVGNPQVATNYFYFNQSLSLAKGKHTFYFSDSASDITTPTETVTVE